MFGPISNIKAEILSGTMSTLCSPCDPPRMIGRQGVAKLSPANTAVPLACALYNGPGSALVDMRTAAWKCQSQPYVNHP